MCIRDSATSYKIILDGTDIDFNGGADVNATATALHTALDGTVAGITPSVTDAVVTLTKADGTDFIYKANDADTFGILNGITDTNDITANNGTVSSFTKAQLNGDLQGKIKSPAQPSIDTMIGLISIGTTAVDTVFSGPIDAQEGLKGDVTGNVNGNCLLYTSDAADE